MLEQKLQRAAGQEPNFGTHHDSTDEKRAESNYPHKDGQHNHHEDNWRWQEG